MGALMKAMLSMASVAVIAVAACAGTINVPGDQATLADALAAAKSEDEVVVAAGDYTLSAGLTVPAGVTVRGATGDPADVRVSGNFGAYAVFTLSADGAEVKDLSIVKARGADNKPGAAAYLTAGTLRNCVISGGELGPRTQGFLYVAGANALATGCVITNNLTGGRGDFDATNGGVVYLTNGTIEDSYIGYNSLCRTYYYTYALPDGPVKVTGGTLRNCVIHKNMMPVRGGVWATGGSVQDCVIWNNSNPYSTTSDHLDVWDGTASKFAGCKARVAINANCEAVDVMPPTDWFGFGMSKSSGFAGHAVSFAAPSDAGECIWNFGDGTEVSGGTETSHSYETPGVYAPTVTYGGKTYAAPETVHIFGIPHAVSTYDALVEAVDNAVDGLEIHIATGEYVPTKMLCVFNGVKFVGAGKDGADATVFNGNKNGKRVFNLNHPDAWVQDVAFRNFQIAMRGAGVTAAVYAGTVSNCVVRSSSFSESANKIASQMSVGGGSGSALVTHCVFSNLTSNCKNAIGVAIAVKVEANGSLENSLVTDCHGSSVKNCYPVWAAGGTVRNCTVVNNTGCEVGGVHAWTQGNLYDAQNPGAAAGWVYNTVVAANSSYSQTARNDVHPGSEARFVNCATAGETALNETCKAATTAKLFNDFAKADYTPAPDSPLIDNGATVENPPEFDLRGKDRVQGKAIDIGCYEMDASAVVLSFSPDPESVFLGEPIVFTGTLTGIDDQSGFTWEWDFDNDGTPDYVGGPVAAWTYETYGSCSVALTVKDADGKTLAPPKVRENVASVNPKVLYVKGDNENPVPPYGSWETAATTIKTAYEAAADGAAIVVSNGTYATGSGLTVEKEVRIRSLTGQPEDVRFIGNAGTADQCYIFYLKNPGCALESVTLDGQRNRNCLYIWGAGGTVTNSIIRNGYSHQAEIYVPGCFIGGEAGVLSHCIVTNCNRDREGMRPNDGMIANSGRISNCLIAGNRSVLNVEAQVTEALIYNGGIIENCTIVNNSYTNGLFMYQSSAGVLKNTILADNWEIGDGSKASPVTGSGTVKSCVTDPDPSKTFVNAANGDWHLVPRSPAVSAGERRPGSLPQVDLDGNPRLFGRLDAGCYESAYMPGMLLLVW